MSWRIDTSKNAEKFLEQNNLAKEELFELVEKAVRYFRGERVNIDIKKLKGRWKGFYRIRRGKCDLLPSSTLKTRLFLLRKSIGEVMSINKD